MIKADGSEQGTQDARIKSVEVFFYPAATGSVDLSDLTFRRPCTAKTFSLSEPTAIEALCTHQPALADQIRALDGPYFDALVAPWETEIAGRDVTLKIISRRSAVLKVEKRETDVLIEAHWNLFIPYFDHIKSLPIVHPEVLETFADAAFHYIALTLTHPGMSKRRLRRLILDAYLDRPELLLASLDIFNKPNVYHIYPTRIWMNRIFSENDRYCLQIDTTDATASLHVNPFFLQDVTLFIHKIVKNFAFRYVHYPWTQRYRIVFGTDTAAGMVTYAGNDIVFNIRPLIGLVPWKPAVYFSLGHAVMLAMLRASRKEDEQVNTCLAMMKTWNRYLSFDEAIEQQSVRELYHIPDLPEDELCHALLAATLGTTCPEAIDDFIMLNNYSARESFTERLTVLSGSKHGDKTGEYFDDLSREISNLNASMMRNNINFGKLVEILRNENIDHLQLTDFLLTGNIDNRQVVDVSEWLLLRTLLYDLINAPKVFRNDYKMLVNVLTKVNKSLIVFIWTLGLDNDPRYAMVSRYVAQLMNDIFVFNRVKIYEIVADPVECLEAEAVTGYLLNWASFKNEERDSIIDGMTAAMPREAITLLHIETAEQAEQLITGMRSRTSGLIGFYLHQAYNWGSTGDAITEQIRAHFPMLLEKTQRALMPAKRIMGGAMLLLVLAQIVSDARDGFAPDTVVTEEDEQIVRNLIKQCTCWNQSHFVMMVAGTAVSYMGRIDEWSLQQFDSLLGRYDGGDRVILRSVVQFDVEKLVERTLLTARAGEETELVKRIQLLRVDVDPVISDQANWGLREMALAHGLECPKALIRKKDIFDLLSALATSVRARAACQG